MSSRDRAEEAVDKAKCRAKEAGISGRDKEKSDRQAADGILNTRTSGLETKIDTFNAREEIRADGPLPAQGSYISKGGTLVIFVSGSGFRSSQVAGRIGMNVPVDGAVRGQLSVLTNERLSHRAFVDGQFVIGGLGAGTHTIRLEPGHFSQCRTNTESTFAMCTSTDLSGNFNATVIEIPTQ